MKIVLYILISVLIIAFGLFSFYEAIKEKEEKKQLQKAYDENIKEQKEKEKIRYEAESVKKGQKEKVNVADDTVAFNNSVDVLSDIAKRRK